jgi:hypothetical protein
MGVILTGIYKSLKGNDWEVQLIDNDGGTASEEMVFDPSGVVITPEGGTNNIFARIIPTSARVTFMVQSPDTHEQFRNLLMGAGEGRFQLQVNLEGSKIFIGTLISDGVEWDNDYYPYPMELVAVDGMADLKDISYLPPEDNPLGARKTLHEHLIACLNYTSIAESFDSSTAFLLVYCEWYESGMGDTSGNPMKQVDVAYHAFATTEGANKIKHLSVYDTLYQLCLFFNARIYFAGGVFVFEQINMRINEDNNVWIYNKTGLTETPISGFSNNGTVDQSIIAVSRGGKFRALPPVRLISLIYKFKINDNYLFGETNTWSHEGCPLTELGNIDIGAGQELFLFVSGIIKMKVTFTEEPTTTALRWKLKFKATIKIGDYYLKREQLSNDFYDPEYSTIEWVEEEAFYEFDSIPSRLMTGIVTVSFPIEISTPAILESGTISFDMCLIGIVGCDQFHEENEFLPVPEIEWWFQVPQMYIADDNNERLQITQSNLTYVNSINNRKEYGETLLLGDGPNTSNKARVKIYDGADWIESEGEWTVAGAGTPTQIQRLILLEMARLVMNPQMIMVGSLIHQDTPPSAIKRLTYVTIDSETSGNYLFMNGAITSANDTFEGQWMKLNLGVADPENINASDIKENITVGSSGSSNTINIAYGDYRPPLYQFFASVTGDEITTSFTLEKLDGQPTDIIRRNLMVFKMGQKLLYDVGFTLNIGDNKIILNAGYEGDSDYFEVYLFV